MFENTFTRVDKKLPINVLKENKTAKSLDVEHDNVHGQSWTP